MVNELIPLKFEKIMQAKTYSCIVMAAGEKKFAIYTDPKSGKAIQNYLIHLERERPSTHDLIEMILQGNDIRIKQVVINDLQDTVYFAKLFLEQNMGEILNICEIDARPSDCITLALINNVPIYCTANVLDKVVLLAKEEAL